MSAVPACAERGQGALALVFLHGIGADRRAFDGELDYFAPHARALAWDMPGYGESAPLEPMTFPALADALVRLLDARAIERAVLVGHSMGGMVAQELVARRPERVAALALCATSPAFGGTGGDWQKKFLADRLRPLEEGKTPADFAPTLVRTIVGDDPDPRGIERAVACMSAVRPATYRAALHAIVEFDRRESLASIRCPTLALAGERDTVTPPAVVKRMAQAIPGSVYRALPGAGHLLNLERPLAFRTVLADFLSDLPG